jgi:sugar phosphate isomerase/epimerase
MKIQLDSAALAALFPEGSETRVQLQNAVIAEFTRRHLKLHAEDTQKRIDSEVRKTIKEALEKEGVDVTYGLVTFSLELKEKIRKQALEEFERACREAVREAAKEVRVEFEHTVKQKIAERVTSATEQAIQLGVMERIAEIAKGLQQ